MMFALVQTGQRVTGSLCAWTCTAYLQKEKRKEIPTCLVERKARDDLEIPLGITWLSG